jgi:uncharacterized protein YjiS (DUF1127 family)
VMAERRQDLQIEPQAILQSLAIVAVRRTTRALAMLLYWHDISRERRALLELDDRMLRDIGITRADAEQEAGRPFWDDAMVRWRDWR